MIRLTDFSFQNWQLAEGICYRDKPYEASYPEDGHALYAAIEETSYWFAHRNRILVERITNLVGSGPFFDIGGGNGIVARALIDAGTETVLVEPGPTGARNARDRGVTHVLCSSLEDAGFYPGSLPAAGIFDVLEHFEDDLGFLKILGQLIRPDGVLFVTVPAYDWLWSEEDEIAGHFRRYTLEGLRKLSARAGLQVRYASYFFATLPLPVFLLRTIPGKLGWRRTGEDQTVVREHSLDGKPGRQLIRSLLDWEYNRIRQGRVVTFGSSCLMILSRDL